MCCLGAAGSVVCVYAGRVCVVCLCVACFSVASVDFLGHLPLSASEQSNVYFFLPYYLRRIRDLRCEDVIRLCVVTVSYVQCDTQRQSHT